MGSCATCTHWQRESLPLTFWRDYKERPDLLRFGQCLRAGGDEEHADPRVASQSNDPYEEAFLFTRDDFGCVAHEEAV